ncbi:ATP-dependent DNA helicase [Haloarchaeobius sp. FL176]|uniref:ATP-dependent helicase n=1 Tax=Haloarchaeobius sp. FL176 TaxID=2967129 RepID=UPI002147421A|nr:ATP-dependent DNA helicase [Haloarchaeobius sp. FL176]
MSLFEEDDDVTEEPKGNQGPIISTDEYPMRVLAGAGTGKTFTMVRKIERLLKTEQTAPGNVLALTFTNKAADSMRSKLNALIGSQGYDIEAYTYHSICHSILQEYPYYADLPSGFTIADDADKLSVAEEAIAEVPYQFVSPDGTYRKTPAEVLLNFISSMKQEGVHPQELEAYLPAPDVLVGLDEMSDRIETAARKHIRRQSVSESSIESFCDDLETFKMELQLEQQSLGSSPLENDISRYLQHLIETIETCQSRIRSRPEEVTVGSKQAAARLPGVLFSAYGSEGREMTRKSDFPTGIPKFPFTLLDRLRSYLSDCKKAADFVHGYRAYEQQREANQLVDFDDLINNTVSLLEDEDIAAEIAGQWDYIFCDEFQDTDSIQFDLVTTLAEQNRLFIVGDDDQAIYEWRGADSENIGRKLDATYGSELQDMELELNFRSRQPILDLANNAIQSLEGRGSEKELTAFGDKAESTSGVAYIDTTVPDNSDYSDTDAFQAAQITTTVGGMLRGELEQVAEEYDPGDIAVLVRKNRHARPIIDAFNEAGIPFELVGDLATESVGVETVLAYLRALADPTDDVSVRRVLLMRYRFSETDLRHLAQAEDNLIDALQSIDPAELSEPERVRTAQSHFDHLVARRHLLSVEQLYHELLSTTNIEWFLTRRERRELQGLEDLITGYDEPASQPPITADFIEYLERHESIAETTDSGPTEQAESADDAVSIMTIHKAKGLDFPVVFLPNLTADEWAPRTREYSELVESLNTDQFWQRDQLKRDQQEARRLLHVGITRAEEHLVLCGQGDESSVRDDGVTLEYAQEWLADGIQWDLTAASFPIWTEIQDSLPSTALDWTEMVTDEASPRGETVATYDGDELGYEDAITTVLERADSLIDGSLPDVEPASVGIAVDAFSPIPAPSIRRRHSYTSLGTVDDCTRKHYLDHVVYAYELPSQFTPTTSETSAKSKQAGYDSSGASNREIGVLFHETAEEAINQNRTGRDEWQEVCEQVAVERGLKHALAGATACIDRFFETPVPEWDLLSAEHSFGIDIEGSYVIGEIDLLARRPDGELVVLDYKATGSKKGTENRQLPLYILACEELFDEPVTTAGYVYVSDLGPEVDLRTYDDTRIEEAQERIKEGLSKAAASSYSEYTAGDHCQWCPHNDLPCSSLHSE